MAKQDPFKVAKDLLAKHGDNIVRSGDAMVSDKQEIVSVSPLIDVNIGGGIPEGSVVLLAGDEKCGKTVTALQICKNAQSMGKNIYYLNIEARLKSRDLEGIEGLDLEKINVVSSYREDDSEGNLVQSKILSGEEWLSFAENFIHNDPGCVVVLDSISQLVTERQLQADIGDVTGDGGFRLLSQFIGRIAPVVVVNKCIVIGIQHLIANTRARPGQKTKSRSGGRKIRYAVDVDLECTYIQPWKASSADDAEQIGQRVNWITRSTARPIPPGRKIESLLRYGVGLDVIGELISLGKSLGFIKVSGSWYVLDYMQNHLDVLGVDEWAVDKKGKLTPEMSKLVQAQGEHKAHDLLKANPDYLDCLQKDIYEMLGMTG